MHSVTYRELLGRNRNFRWLWMGQIISELGTWFSFIAELGLVRLISGSTWATTVQLSLDRLVVVTALPEESTAPGTTASGIVIAVLVLL